MKLFKKTLSLLMIFAIVLCSIPLLSLNTNAATQITSVKLNQKKMSISNNLCPYLYATVTPKNASTKNLKWSSSNNQVATVESGNTICPVGFGKTTITVSSPDGKYKDTCELTVKAGFVLTAKEKSPYSVKIGDTQILYLYLLDYNGKKLPVKDVKVSYSTSIATIKKSVKQDVIELAVTGTKRGSFQLACTADTPATVNYFNITVYKENEEFLYSAVPVTNNKLKTNFSQAEMTVDNYKYSFDSKKSIYSVTMDVYNRSGAYGAAVSYDQDGKVYDQATISSHDNFPSDYVGFFTVLGKGAAGYINGSAFNYRSVLDSTKTSVSIKVPAGGSLTISSDMFSCSTAGAYNLAIMIINAALYSIKVADKKINASPKESDTLKALLEEFPTYPDVFKKIATESLKQLSGTMSLQSVKNNVSTCFEIFQKICESGGKDFSDLITNVMKKVGISVAKTAATKFVISKAILAGIATKSQFAIAELMFKGGDIVEYVNHVLYATRFDTYSGLTRIRFGSAAQQPTITTTNYVGGISVSLKSSTSGASIYYTTDGKDPTTSSAKYTGPFNLTTTKTVKAIAVKKDLAISKIFSKQIVVNQTKKPVISTKKSGNSTQVTITSEKGTTIYYTTNGSEPSTKSTKYTGAFTLKSPATVKAIAVKNGQKNSPTESISTSDINGITKITFPLSTSQVWYCSTYVGHGGNLKSAYSSIDITLKNKKSAAGYAVYAVADGEVVSYISGNGQITIKHTSKLTTTNKVSYDQWYSTYAHMTNISVKKGTKVKAGQQIGKVGAVGKATGPHLHISFCSGEDGVSWDQQKSTKYAISPYYIYGMVTEKGANTSYLIRDMQGTGVTNQLINHKPTKEDPKPAAGSNNITATWSKISVSNIGITNAQINGTVTFNKTVKHEKCGFYFGTSSSNLQKVSKYDTINANRTLTGMSYDLNKYGQTLKAGTTYYYQFYIVADGKEYKSSVNSFTTSKAAAPAVTAAWSKISVSNLGATNAQINGTVTFNKTLKHEKCGFYFGTSSSNLQKASKYDTINANRTLTGMSYNLNKYGQTLKSKTTYYYQFYIVAGGSEYKSPVYSFTTK